MAARSPAQDIFNCDTVMRVERIDFPSLSAATLVTGTETAQRFLGSAYDSVSDLFEWHQSAQELAEEDKREDPEFGARTEQSAEDMLRAMIVFAATGLDAVAKQLVRDSLRLLITVSDLASSKLLDFAALRLEASAPGNSRRLAAYLLSGNPRGALVEDYVYELTGASLQSVEQVDRVLGALGIAEPRVRQSSRDLKPLFVARNQIVHELDLVQPAVIGDRHRRTRSMEEAKTLAHLGLETSQQIINAVGRVLEPGMDNHP